MLLVISSAQLSSCPTRKSHFYLVSLGPCNEHQICQVSISIGSYELLLSLKKLYSILFLSVWSLENITFSIFCRLSVSTEYTSQHWCGIWWLGLTRAYGAGVLPNLLMKKGAERNWRMGSSRTSRKRQDQLRPLSSGNSLFNQKMYCPLVTKVDTETFSNMGR